LTKKDHPNLVHVYDLGREDGVPYYVMEFVEGITLGEAMEERPRIGQVLWMFARLCGAVSVLHQAGIRHRDLKPSNVRVRIDGGEPVLIDFGLCLPLVARTLTGPHELLGTPWYLSPEYAAHWLEPEQTRPYIPLSTDDVWALGIMLYEILTGGVPWLSPPERPEVLLKEIRDFTPPHPSDVYPRVPRAVGDVVMRMLEKRLSKRLKNADEVLKALGRAAEGQDVLSPIAPRRRPGWARRRVQKRSNGERGQAMQAALIFSLCLCVTAGAGYYLGTRAETLGLVQRAQVLPKQAVRPNVRTPLNTEPREATTPLPQGPNPLAPLTADPLMQIMQEIQNWISPGYGKGKPLPKAPFKGQYLAPCPDPFVELVGACWLRTRVYDKNGKQVSCPETTFEHQGDCLQPVKAGTPNALKKKASSTEG